MQLVTTTTTDGYFLNAKSPLQKPTFTPCTPFLKQIINMGALDGGVPMSRVDFKKQ